MTSVTLTPEAVAIREAIEFAPLDGTKTAEGLLGLWTPEGWYVCAPCVGRITARGCGYALKGATQVWSDAPVYGVCLCCETEVARG